MGEQRDVQKVGCMGGGDESDAESSSTGGGSEPELPPAGAGDGDGAQAPASSAIEISKPNRFIEKGEGKKVPVVAMACDEGEEDDGAGNANGNADSGGQPAVVDPAEESSNVPQPLLDDTDFANTSIEAMEQVIAAELGTPLDATLAVSGSGDENAQFEFDPSVPLPADVDALIDEELGYDPVDHILKEKRRELLLKEEHRKAHYEQCLQTLDGTIAAQEMLDSFEQEITQQ